MNKENLVKRLNTIMIVLFSIFIGPFVMRNFHFPGALGGLLHSLRRAYFSDSFEIFTLILVTTTLLLGLLTLFLIRKNLTSKILLLAFSFFSPVMFFGAISYLSKINFFDQISFRLLLYVFFLAFYFFIGFIFLQKTNLRFRKITLLSMLFFLGLAVSIYLPSKLFPVPEGARYVGHFDPYISGFPLPSHVTSGGFNSGEYHYSILLGFYLVNFLSLLLILSPFYIKFKTKLDLALDSKWFWPIVLPLILILISVVLIISAFNDIYWFLFQVNENPFTCC